MSDREAIIEAFALFSNQLRDELRRGFGQVSSRIDATNARLDETNNRLDQTIVRLDETVVRLDQTVVRLDETVVRLDQTVVRLDETNTRLDKTTSTLESFRSEVTEKLDGISNFLLASEKAHGRLEARVTILEGRMDKVERKRKSS